MSLKSRSTSAVFWSGADIFVRRGLLFLISIFLARLLTPEEFGTIALLYLFTGIASVFVDSGFSAALIQRQDITHTDESTVFWFNLAMGFLVAGVFWLLAPWIASFFNLAILVPLVKVLAVNIAISSLGGVHSTLLIKNLDFKTLMKVGSVSVFFSGLIAVQLARHGYGVWALAIQALVSTLITTILLWLFSSWRPRIVFRVDSIKRLFSFGGYLLLSGLLDVIHNRLYSLLIGKFYSIRELGFYNRAEATKELPVGMVTEVLSKVSFPVFSEIAHDKEKLRQGVRLTLRSVMLFNLPAMLGLMAVAEPLIATLFGSQWLPSVPILQVLCLVGALWPLHVVNLNVLKAQGHTGLFFRVEVVKKTLGTVFVIIGAQHGVIGIAWSQVCFGVVAFLINAHYTQKYLDYGFVKQTLDFLPVAAVAVVMAIAVYAIGELLTFPYFLRLILQLSVGAALFIGCVHALRLKAFVDVLSLLTTRRISYPASS